MGKAKPQWFRIESQIRSRDDRRKARSVKRARAFQAANHRAFLRTIGNG